MIIKESFRDENGSIIECVSILEEENTIEQILSYSRNHVRDESNFLYIWFYLGDFKIAIFCKAIVGTESLAINSRDGRVKFVDVSKY